MSGLVRSEELRREGLTAALTLANSINNYNSFTKTAPAPVLRLSEVLDFAEHFEHWLVTGKRKED